LKDDDHQEKQAEITVKADPNAKLDLNTTRTIEALFEVHFNIHD